MRDVAAIFELDEHGEATGVVAHYCSERCAEKDPITPTFEFPGFVHGTSGDAVAGTTCWHCGEPLEQEEIR